MAPHTRVYRWMQRNPFLVDLVTAFLMWLVLAVPMGFGYMAWGAVASTALIAPLPWRRVRPEAAGIAMIAVCVVLWVANLGPMPALIAVPIMIYSMAAYAARWASFLGLGAGVLGSFLFSFRNAWSGWGTAPTGFEVVPPSGAPLQTKVFVGVLVALAVGVAWLLGDLARTRRLALKALEDRAHRLEVEQQQERDLAAADERSHIAREMHDIVAHSLSVIITQADGARYASRTDPQVAGKTLGTIAETGRSSLREMRRLLGVLRSDEAMATRPLPTLADIPSLVASVRTSGVDVSLASVGEPRRELPPGAELTAYRVIQESLTNTMKHAGERARASVSLTWDGKGLRLEVSDDGRGAAADPATMGAQQGLVGMRERVTLYDGHVQAGPCAGGGFKVDAFIPYSEA